MKKKRNTTSLARGIRTYLHEYRFLLFLVIPLTVLGIANFLFERSIAPNEVHFQFVRSLFELGPNKAELSSSGEIRTRFLWMASCVALIVTSLAAIIVSFLVMRNCLHRRQIRLALIIILTLIIGQLWLLAQPDSTTQAINFKLTMDLLNASKMLDEKFLAREVWYTAYTTVFVATVAAMALFGAASATVTSDAGNKTELSHHIATRMRQLKTVLYVGSIMLMAGVINMGAWLRWPAAMFQDPEKASAIIGMALGVTTFWGASFTLVTMAAYLPPAFYLRHRALTGFRETHPRASMKRQEKWIQQEGFIILGGTQKMPVLAMIGPLLAGPLGAFFNNLARILSAS